MERVMSRVQWFPLLGLAGFLAMASSALGTVDPYIGFVYPAGGQQGTSVQIRLGGQRIDGTSGAVVTGEGVSAKLVKYYRRLSNQELTLMREQVRELKQEAARKNKAANAKAKGKGKARPVPLSKEKQEMIARIEKRMREWVNRPACAALSAIAVIEVSIAPDAKPGPREIRLITARGMTNPMPFHIGQVPEVARKPMITSVFQVLGKGRAGATEEATRGRGGDGHHPCTMNGQIASGELNRYRFEAKKGQRLVAAVDARSLVPYIADAVPGWFQPVVTICDADGKEVAYNDDFRFKPDPTLYFEVPKDGEYVLTITDAIYRGREDFVYRVTLGEVPYLTNIFPSGDAWVNRRRWKWTAGTLTMRRSSRPARKRRRASIGSPPRKGRMVTNRVPFALDTLPECFDAESNDDPAHAQQVKLPVIVNGRIDQSDDWDVFQVEGKAGEKIVAEVHARVSIRPWILCSN
jgi:hypothetical protein